MKPETIEKIKQHYNHAREKHPYFCDRLVVASGGVPTWSYRLEASRKWLKEEIENGKLTAETILLCEVAEMLDAIQQNNIAQAIEEAHDCNAVLLRIVDVLEGRQELGNPTKKEGAK
jgi:NTP pyrophosphatase (non-canonical NTP hydrolase)